MDVRVIEQLQNHLDEWAATIYLSSEEREQALRSILAACGDRAIEQFVALSRARDRLAGIWEILEDAWHDKGTVTDWEGLQESDLDDSREPRAGPPNAEEVQSEEVVPSETLREMEYLHGYHPRWLKRDLIDDYFPWEQAQATTMATFLEHYTLHDSILVGLWLMERGGLVAVVHWDPVWVNFEEERVDFSVDDTDIDPLVVAEWGDDVAFWPYLLIRFPKLYTLRCLGGRDNPTELGGSNIYAASSKPVPNDQPADLRSVAGERVPDHGDDGRLHETQIEGGYRDGLQIIHNSQIAILCLNRAGRIVTIPDL